MDGDGRPPILAAATDTGTNLGVRAAYSAYPSNRWARRRSSQRAFAVRSTKSAHNVRRRSMLPDAAVNEVIVSNSPL